MHGKKSPLPKGDLVDRLTGQNNGFGPGRTEKKSGEGYCEVFTSRTTRQQDEGFLSYARQLFPNYNFFFYFFYVYYFIIIFLCLLSFFYVYYFIFYFLCLWFYRYWRVQRKSLLSREFYMREHPWITCMSMSCWIYWKWTKLHRWV